MVTGEFGSPQTKKKNCTITGLSFGSPKDISDAIKNEKIAQAELEPVKEHSVIMSVFSKKLENIQESF